MKIDRQIGILSMLLQKDTVTAPYLAEKFEVSRWTINRDIEDLCKAGIPIVTKQGVNGGISIMEHYKLDKTLFHREKWFMRYTWIDEYLLSKAGVTKDLQKDWNWIRYQIGGKMFVAVCLGENDEPYYITLKLDPTEGDFLRQQYEDIIPGYYMNKTHWNSIKPDGEVPDNLLKDLLDKSYQLVLGGFSKKKQREILEVAQRE